MYKDNSFYLIKEAIIESPTDVYFNHSFSISIYNVPKNIIKYYFGDRNQPFCKIIFFSIFFNYYNNNHLLQFYS
jgi:hypothetical protein